MQRIALMVSIGVLLCPRSNAQEVLRSIPDLWEFDPNKPQLPVGSFSYIGDITGDGIRDFVVGQFAWSGGSFRLNGRVRVHSGKDASVLRTYIGSESFQFFGGFVAAFGDLNGDRIPDYMATNNLSGPSSFIWSGADGSELRRIEMWDSKTSLGDLDGDGIASFVTSFGLLGGLGNVLVYHGLDVRYRLDSPPGAVNFGLGLQGLGDLDGDGYADFAAAAPGEPFGGPCELGQVFVYSGKEGRLLYRIEAPGPGLLTMFGREMASPGDFTGDGVADLVIAASERGCNFEGIGRITFHDGSTGTALGEFDLAQTPIPVLERLGRVLTAAGDLNGNGFGDVIATFSAPQDDGSGTQKLIVAIDGGTHELIYVVPDPYGDACQGYIRNLHPAGDPNGDGFPDFTASTHCHPPPDSRLDIISGAPLGVKSFGEPCGDGEGPLPRIGVSGLPLVGTDFRLYLSQVAPGQDAILVLGSSSTHWGRIPLPIRLARYGGCLLYVAPDKRIRCRASRIRPGEGAAEVVIPIPNDPALIGTTLYAQWLLRAGPVHSSPRGTPEPGPYPLHKRATTRALAIRVQTSPFPQEALSTAASPSSGTSLPQGGPAPAAHPVRGWRANGERRRGGQ